MSDPQNRLDPKKLSTPADKAEHIRLCLETDVASGLSNGFERYRLAHNPLPELQYDHVDTSCEFLGKKISAPFIISPMTGGSALSETINRNIAIAAQRIGVALSVGSQRLALDDPSLAGTYLIRKEAPDVPVVANLGAVYLNYGWGLEHCKKIVDMIQADALGLYLNPMQKAMQGLKNLDFTQLAEKIERIASRLDVPVLVKEVGFGLSAETAVRLRRGGVHVFDVAGAGGTSWAKITRKMKKHAGENIHACFDQWGTPTAEALVDVRRAVPDAYLIASGGIRNGLDMAKALALGADGVGMALPLLRPALDSAERVVSRINAVLTELKIAMFCCGAPTVKALQTDASRIARISGNP